MLSKRSISPQFAALLAAMPLAAILAIGIYVYERDFLLALLVFGALSALGYAIIFFVIQRFIYRRIKLIYKLIYQTKATKKEEFYQKNLLPQKTLKEVGSDVEKWAVQHKMELDTLRQSEKYRKEFLYNLSHELKTPVFAIQGYIDTLVGGALNNPAVNERFLGNAARNVDRLVSLIQDLDEITRVESGELTLEKENFVVQEVFKEVCESLSIKAEHKKIRCFIKPGCEQPFPVWGDKEKIRMVIINLVDNAIKYGKQNGHIEGSFYRIDAKNILIEISDNGHGMAEEHLSRIFERFYRTDEARARKEGGSGLGLSIAKHMIEAHDSTIHVRSKLNVGTTFGFILPAGRLSH